MRPRLVGGLAVAAVLSGVAAWAQPASPPPPPPAFEGQTRAPAPETPSPKIEVQVVARGLNAPWSIVFLPDGRMMVAEKWGTIRLIRPDGVISAPIAGVPPVKATAAEGMHGIALDPDFPHNRLVYFVYFSPPSGEDPAIWPTPFFYDKEMALPLAERRAKSVGMESLARGRLSADGKRFEDVKVLLHGPDRRVMFGPDGKLYATGPDRFRLYNSDLDGLDVADAPPLDRMNYAGRVSRINPDGSIPRDNPFVRQAGVDPDVFAFGIRDPEGAAFDPAGQLWEVEHGPKGGDELNLIHAGADYGWPVISYGVQYNNKPVNNGLTTKAGMTQPVYFWNPDVGPAGMVFYTGGMFPAWKGDLLVGALTARKLIRLQVQGGRVVSEESLLEDRKQRIRDVAQAPDGSVVLLTDDGDVLRLVPKS